jgi:hypothetical protein
MRLVQARATVGCMEPASYAMTWNVGDGPRRAGRIEVRADAVELTASARSVPVKRITFAEIAGVAVARGVLHVRRFAGPELRIGSIDSPGALGELADRVSAAIVAAPAR